MVERPFPNYRDIRKKATCKLECHLCGACCDLSEGSMDCSRDDLERWLKEDRTEVLKFVRYEIDSLGQIVNFDPEIWRDPNSEFPNPVIRCPFFRCDWDSGFRCLIWDTRPFACSDFEVGGIRCIQARQRCLRF